MRTFLILLILVLAFCLRVAFLGNHPLSLYSDEANQGYNAYSILKTGSDEHGVFLPVSLRSFGDWKPPLQTYLMIPSIAIFGLSEFSIRLPNALLGTLSVFIVYLLIKLVFKHEKLALINSLLIAISPWHLHQSRSAMLVMISYFFFISGIYLFIRNTTKKYILYFFSAMMLAASIYSYYGMRVIIPLFLIYLIIKYERQLINKRVTFFILVLLFFLSPLIINYFYNPNVIFGRAKSISVFYDDGIRLKLSLFKEQDYLQYISNWQTIFFHDKFYLYFLDISKRFLSHLNGSFLFIKGDTAPPFLIPNMGVLYILDLIFLLVGFYYLGRYDKSRLIAVWLIASIIPAALSFMTPSHNRSFNAVFPLTFITSLGLVKIVKNKLPITFLLLSLLYTVFFSRYLISYYKVIPIEHSDQWLYGFKEVINYLKENNDKFEKIIFLPQTGMAYTYVLFYTQYPPELVPTTIERIYKADEFGFEHVSTLSKYWFLRKNRTWEELEHNMETGELYIGREGEIPPDKGKKEILYPNGKVAFRISYI